MTGATPLLEPVAFIVGTPRSGTTLLRVMLAGHPSLFSPPEMLLAPFETMQERADHLRERFWEVGGLRRALMALQRLDVDGATAAVRALEERRMTIPEVYAYLQALLGGRLLIDKCPHLCGSPAALERLARWFPEARYLWIVRHPAAVLRSIEHQPMADLIVRSYAGDVRELWHRANSRLRRHLEAVPRERWAMIRYEDLVAAPRPAMERACAALGVPFHEAVLDPYEGDRMREGPPGARAVGDPSMAARGRIDPSLATRWLDGFDPRTLPAEAAALARELGYDLDHLPLPPLARVADRLRELLDTVRELDASIGERDQRDALEGRRFLLRLQAAVVGHVLGGDGTRPAPRTPGSWSFLDDALAALGSTPPWRALDAEGLGADLARATGTLRAVFERTVDCSRLWSVIAEGRFVEVPGERLLAPPDVRLLVACYHLERGRRALVRGRGLAGPSFGLGLFTPWLEPVESRGRTWIGGPHLAAGPDGAFEVAVAHEDPGRAVWLDAGGRERGFVIARTIVSLAPPPELTLELLADHGAGRE